jgi:hypothetical protein
MSVPAFLFLRSAQGCSCHFGSSAIRRAAVGSLLRWRLPDPGRNPNRFVLLDR